MTIKQLIDLGIYDENEHISIFSGDVNRPTRHFDGYLCDIPENLLNNTFESVGAMSERRSEQFHLNNKYGRTEIWLDFEEDII